MWVKTTLVARRDRNEPFFICVKKRRDLILLLFCGPVPLFFFFFLAPETNFVHALGLFAHFCQPQTGDVEQKKKVQPQSRGLGFRVVCCWRFEVLGFAVFGPGVLRARKEEQFFEPRARTAWSTQKNKKQPEWAGERVRTKKKESTRRRVGVIVFLGAFCFWLITMMFFFDIFLCIVFLFFFVIVFQCSLVLVFSCVTMCAVLGPNVPWLGLDALGPGVPKMGVAGVGELTTRNSAFFFFWKSFSAVFDSPTPHQNAHWSYVGTSCETLAANRLATGARTRRQQRSPDAHFGLSRTFKKTATIPSYNPKRGAEKTEDTLVTPLHPYTLETSQRQPGDTSERPPDRHPSERRAWWRWKKGGGWQGREGSKEGFNDQKAEFQMKFNGRGRIGSNRIWPTTGRDRIWSFSVLTKFCQMSSSILWCVPHLCVCGRVQDFWLHFGTFGSRFQRWLCTSGPPWP